MARAVPTGVGSKGVTAVGSWALCAGGKGGAVVHIHLYACGCTQRHTLTQSNRHKILLRPMSNDPLNTHTLTHTYTVHTHSTLTHMHVHTHTQA